ncbi:unnamed protein product [Ixodes pacificus]
MATPWTMTIESEGSAASSDGVWPGWSMATHTELRRPLGDGGGSAAFSGDPARFTFCILGFLGPSSFMSVSSTIMTGTEDLRTGGDSTVGSSVAAGSYLKMMGSPYSFSSSSSGSGDRSWRPPKDLRFCDPGDRGDWDGDDTLLGGDSTSNGTSGVRFKGGGMWSLRFGVEGGGVAGTDSFGSSLGSCFDGSSSEGFLSFGDLASGFDREPRFRDGARSGSFSAGTSPLTWLCGFAIISGSGSVGCKAKERSAERGGSGGAEVPEREGLGRARHADGLAQSLRRRKKEKTVKDGCRYGQRYDTRLREDQLKINLSFLTPDGLRHQIKTV